MDYYICPAYVLGKLYSNSLLVLFNFEFVGKIINEGVGNVFGTVVDADNDLIATTERNGFIFLSRFLKIFQRSESCQSSESNVSNIELGPRIEGVEQRSSDVNVRSFVILAFCIHWQFCFNPLSAIRDHLRSRHLAISEKHRAGALTNRPVLDIRELIQSAKVKRNHDVAIEIKTKTKSGIAISSSSIN